MNRKLGIVILFNFLFVSVICGDSNSSEDSSEERRSERSENEKISIVNFNGVLDAKSLPNMNLVEELEIKDCKLDVVSSLSMPKLRKVKVEHSQIDIKVGDVSDDFSGLEKVTIEHCTISIIDKTTFSNLPNMKELNIENTIIGDLKKDMFSGNVKLEEFECKHCGIANIEVGAFNDLLALEELDLANNKLEKFFFGNLPLLPKLKEINLSHNPLATINLDKIKENCPKLKKIELEGVNLEADIKRQLKQMHIDVET